MNMGNALVGVVQPAQRLANGTFVPYVELGPCKRQTLIQQLRRVHPEAHVQSIGSKRQLSYRHWCQEHNLHYQGEHVPQRTWWCDSINQGFMKHLWSVEDKLTALQYHPFLERDIHWRVTVDHVHSDTLHFGKRSLQLPFDTKQSEHTLKMEIIWTNKSLPPWSRTFYQLTTQQVLDNLMLAPGEY